MQQSAETTAAIAAYDRLRTAVAKKPTAVSLSKKLMNFHQAGMHDQCPDGIYTKIPLTADEQLTDYNFSIKE